jgi:hypothetical protein
MKSKQTLKVGDSVRVIKPSSYYLFKEGFIEKKGDVYDWEVSIDDETHYYDNKDIQLITPKKSHWKYSRESLDNSMDLIISHLPNYTEKELKQDLSNFKKDILVKSTPKKKSKEIKEEDKKECHCGKNGHALNSINCPIHGKSPSLLNDIETIEELNLPSEMEITSTEAVYCLEYFLKKVIKNQRIHTEILNLLIKNK